MSLLFLIAWYQAAADRLCVVDQCDDYYCAVETPEGFVDVPRSRETYEGAEIVCPTWLVEPT